MAQQKYKHTLSLRMHSYNNLSRCNNLITGAAPFRFGSSITLEGRRGRCVRDQQPSGAMVSLITSVKKLGL